MKFVIDGEPKSVEELDVPAGECSPITTHRSAQTGQADLASHCLPQEWLVVAGTVPAGPDHHWQQLGCSAAAAASESVLDSTLLLQYPGVFCGAFVPWSTHPARLSSVQPEQAA
ncbi:hypothetical protein Salat_1049000 [Sesamum alatum]|uniref:Uncharacterized protein n=1 Tax=Sesamum alatum TaxID=300844 RepID=A0AAE1YNH1_9LAMI|nr:hypothetical protein Salat_1049000 [Sesamum alatum]